MYPKDPYETKYQFLVNKRESIGLKHFNDPKNPNINDPNSFWWYDCWYD